MHERAGDSEPYVFVSYASVDRDRVLPVVNALRDHGFAVWLDQDDIGGGEIYGPEIVSAIERCSALVLMCSAAALASPNVRQEIALAWKYRRPYLPLLIEPVTIPRDVEYWLEGAQWIELYGRPAEHWTPRLIEAVERQTGVAVRPERVSASASTPTLFLAPVPLNPIVGRDSEISEIAELIDAVRLITLTGAGGTGKTRLALAVAQAVRDRFAGDIVFIDLAPVHDPGLVTAEIASALGIQMIGDQPTLETLTRVLARRRLLLMLDNLEQVVDAAQDIGVVLARCPEVRVLATSRSPLWIAGEQEYPVAPLPLPDASSGLDPEQLIQNDAVRLFAQSARTVRPGFQVTSDNAESVAAICARLDGLPLAIELAAARMRTLSPETLLDRLGQRLPLLTGGRRDAPARQQTLRNTIAWSYDMLLSADQALFRRLSVFAGGWTLEAAEQVDGNDADIIDRLETLVGHSLVQMRDLPSPRYGMLETIREFGADQLAGLDEEAEVRDRHAAWALGFVDEVAPRTRGPESIAAIRQLDIEHANVRTALEWFIVRQDAASGWRLAARMWLFWWMRNHLREGRQHFRQLLDLPRDDVPAWALACGMTGAGVMAEWLDDLGEAERFQTEALRLWDAVPDARNAVDRPWPHASLFNIAMRRGDYERASVHARAQRAAAAETEDDFAQAMAVIGIAYLAVIAGDLAESEALLRQGLDHARRSGDPWAMSLTLGNLAQTRLTRGELTGLDAYIDEKIAIDRETQHQYQLAAALNLRSQLALLQDRPEDALRDAEESLAISRRIGESYTQAGLMNSAAQILVHLRRFDEALALYRESLLLTREPEMPEIAVAALDGIARLLRATGRYQPALRLAAAVVAIRASLGIGTVDAHDGPIEDLIAAMEHDLSPTEIAAEQSAGSTMSLRDAIACALDHG